MTKKQKILQIFNEADWIKSPSGKRIKILLCDSFHAMGLDSTIEYQEKYCDIIYARQIFNKLGYSVFVGQQFYVVER